MTDITLTAIEQGLQQPFAPEIVQYLPKAPKQRPSGEWVCLALPYADKRAYEDRLNDLAFGEWSTPYNPPYAVGNKLVIPVTVTICGVEHTDYGEAFLTSTARNGDQSGAENSATEAYSQGFRRACAQFRLGRYFYALPKLWVAYDPTHKVIALTAEQKYQMTLRLYAHENLLPSSSHVSCAPGTSGIPSTPRSIPSASPHGFPGAGAIVTPEPSEPLVSEPVTPEHVPSVAVPITPTAIATTALAVVIPAASPVSVSSGSPKPTASSVPFAAPQVPQASAAEAIPHFSIQEQKRRWLELQLKQDAGRIQRVCEQYQVQSLDQLSEAQFVHLANRIFAAQQRAQQKHAHVKSQATNSPTSSSSCRTNVAPQAPYSAHDATKIAVKGR